MKSIDLGKISIPVDQYASQGNAVLGIRGSGKSYSATYTAERLLDAGVPIVAFDPIGIWRFLRVPAKEGGHGYKVVVAGGEHGDIPLPAQGAAEIMRAAMRDGVSIVFDLYDIHLSKGDWRRVVESAIKVLLYENKAYGLRHIFLEEAAEFCPQRIQPDQGAVYSAIERLARMGGNAQLGYTLINQRAEEVNKAVLELCDLLILHRQKGRNSLTALSKWLDVAQAKGEIAAKIPVLENGECYIWPAGDAQPVRTKIPAKRTFHPDRKAMQKASIVESKGADVSAFVATMRESLQALTKEAEANDPKLLRARIAELEREARKPRELAIDVKALEQAELRGLEAGVQAGLDAAAAPLKARVEQAAALVRQAADAMAALGTMLAKGQQASDVPHPKRMPIVIQRQPAAAAPRLQIQRKPAGAAGAGDSSIGNSGKRRMLVALAQNPDGLSYTKLSLLTGISQSGGTWRTYLGELRSQGLVEGNNPVRITQAGLQALGDYEPLPTGQALIEYWRGRLGQSGKRAIFDVVVDAYPRGIAQEDVSAKTGIAMSGGTWRTYLGELRGLELVTGRGELRASEELFA